MDSAHVRQASADVANYLKTSRLHFFVLFLSVLLHKMSILYCMQTSPAQQMHQCAQLSVLCGCPLLLAQNAPDQAYLAALQRAAMDAIPWVEETYKAYSGGEQTEVTDTCTNELLLYIICDSRHCQSQRWMDAKTLYQPH